LDDNLFIKDKRELNICGVENLLEMCCDAALLSK